MDPLNRDYDNLGLSREFGEPIEVNDIEDIPIRAADVAWYTKAIQKAMEWEAAAIFCIRLRIRTNGQVTHSGDARKDERNARKAIRVNREKSIPGDQARYEKERAAYRKEVEKTREWLEKENEARREKGIVTQGGAQLRRVGSRSNRSDSSAATDSGRRASSDPAKTSFAATDHSGRH